MKHKKKGKQCLENPEEQSCLEADGKKCDPSRSGRKSEESGNEDKGATKVSAFMMREIDKTTSSEFQSYEGDTTASVCKKKGKKYKKEKDVSILDTDNSTTNIDKGSLVKRKSSSTTDLEILDVKKRRSSYETLQTSEKVLQINMEEDCPENETSGTTLSDCHDIEHKFVTGKESECERFSKKKTKSRDRSVDKEISMSKQEKKREGSLHRTEKMRESSNENLTDSLESRKEKKSAFSQESGNVKLDKKRQDASQDRHRESSLSRKKERDHSQETTRERSLSRKQKKDKTRITMETDSKSNAEENKLKVDLSWSVMEEKSSQQKALERGDCIDGHMDSEENRNGFMVLEASTGALLILKYPVRICVKGRAAIKALCGSVTVLGFEVKPSEKFYKIYSPESHSLLTIQSENGEKDNSAMLQLIKTHAKSEADVKLPRGELVVLLVENLESNMCDFVSTIPPYQQLFTRPASTGEVSGSEELSSRVGLHLVTDQRFPQIRFSEDQLSAADVWKSALEQQVTGSAPVVVTCGGKNAGKSTMNRLLINTALNVVDKVCYLECDIGQTEFTPPGCVALHIIEEPVLGPPFTHQWQPSYMCCYGGVSPSDNPRFYINCVQKVYRHYKQMVPPIPLVVNTMGWNKGLGLLLFVDTLRIVSPDIVVQLDCKRRDQNFPAITSEFRAEADGFTSHSEITPENFQPDANIELPNHSLLQLNTVVEPWHVSFAKMKPIDHRHLSLLGYLASDLEPGLSLTSYPPYSVPWNEIGIHMSHVSVPQTQIMCSLNATIIALCSGDLSEAHRKDKSWPWMFEKTPLCRCLGFGFVRGVDPDLKLVYVATPLPLRRLEKVNILLRGITNLPDQILLRQDVPAGLPYVDDTFSSTGASALRARRHMPRRPQPESAQR